MCRTCMHCDIEPSWVGFRLILCWLAVKSSNFVWIFFVFFIQFKFVADLDDFETHVCTRSAESTSWTLNCDKTSRCRRRFCEPWICHCWWSMRALVGLFCVFCLHLHRSTSISVSVVSRRSTMGGSETYRWNLVRFFQFSLKRTFQWCEFSLFLLFFVNRMHEWGRVFRLFSHARRWLTHKYWVERNAMFLELNKNHFVFHSFFVFHSTRN